MRHARSVLANQVPVEEVDAVEVSQKIAFEERADRLADALAGNLDHVRAVIARLALNSERQRLAGGRIALIVYRSDERHRRAGADILRLARADQSFDVDRVVVAQVVARGR